MTIAQLIIVDLTHPLVLGGVAALVALHLLALGEVRSGARFAGSVSLAWVLAYVLKAIVRDPRPANGVIGAWGSGWPSGHAAVAAAAALSLWFLWARRARDARRATGAALLAAFALAVAASRLYLGVHDLGDVAGGLAVGLAAAYWLRPRR